MKKYKERIITTTVDTRSGVVTRQEIIREPVKSGWMGFALFFISIAIRYFLMS